MTVFRSQAERAPRDTGDPRGPRGHIETRTIWRAVVFIAAAGILTLGVLFMMWQTGRVPAVRTLPPTPGALVSFEGSFPAGGRGPLSNPRSIATDGERLYVTEPDAGRISVFESDGRFVRTLRIEAEGPAYPIDATVVGEAIYVVDTAANRILSMPVTGGRAQHVAKDLKRPTALVADGANVLISDAEMGLVRLSPESGQIEPIATSTAARVYGGGIVRAGASAFVTDTGGSRVLEIDVSSGQVTAFGGRVSLPRGLSFDSAGRLWVADVFGGTVLVFDGAGQPLGDIETEDVSGAGAPALGAPQGLVYLDEESRLYVVDGKGGRVFAYGVSR